MIDVTVNIAKAKKRPNPQVLSQLQRFLWGPGDKKRAENLNTSSDRHTPSQT